MEPLTHQGEIPSNLDWDAESQIELEQRFLQNGTVVVTREGALLQAIKIRGSSKSREVHFAASNKSSHAAVKTKPSAVVASDRAGGFSHVFRNIVGQTFVPRVDANAALGPPPALMFSVIGLLAEAKDKELKTVRLIASVGGSAVAEPIEIEVSVFVRTFGPAEDQPPHSGPRAARRSARPCS